NLSSINPGSITSYNWNFGDGSINSSVINPNHTYSQQGNYNVTLTATSNNGCVDSTTTAVTVLPNPTANFTSTSVCPNDSCVFTDLSNNGSTLISDWTWDFGDGTSMLSGINNPSHAYANSGNYNVTLIATDINGCIDTAVGIATIKIAPDAAFNFIPPFCAGVGVPTSNTSTSQSSAINSSFSISGQLSCFIINYQYKRMF
ncbi:MAG: hypothetical protein RLZZ94_1870, partial [Bacteroidota bacterium]